MTAARPQQQIGQVGLTTGPDIQKIVCWQNTRLLAKYTSNAENCPVCRARLIQLQLHIQSCCAFDELCGRPETFPTALHT